MDKVGRGKMDGSPQRTLRVKSDEINGGKTRLVENRCGDGLIDQRRTD